MQKRLQEQIDYWRISAGHNWATAQSLFKSKRYDACLFFCHLVLEKMLKGLVVGQTQKDAPYIHNLEKLAKLAKIELTAEQVKNLKIITGFNIAGRYDDAKFDFYKVCTKPYTKKYFEISKELYLWLKKEYQKN